MIDNQVINNKLLIKMDIASLVAPKTHSRPNVLFSFVLESQSSPTRSPKFTFGASLNPKSR